MYYELTDHFEVSADIDSCWQFFSSAANLPKITPPWLAFTNVSAEPITITQDTILDYTIRWAGVPVKWRTKIIDFTPPRQFIDLQIRGPYALWHHQHTFDRSESGGTICRDRVIYALPFGPLGRLTHATVVRKQLREIFRFRRTVIGEHLGWVRAIQPDVHVAPLR